jgi:hypothetical protein
MRKPLLILLFFISSAVAGFMIITAAHADLSVLPPLESGDLIFETTLTNQTLATLLATRSLYTHVGIIHVHEDGTVTVVQASKTVVESSLADFADAGLGERFTIMRYNGLTDEQRSAIAQDAERYLGVPYNYIFDMRSKNLYCSLLPYRTFGDLGLPLGTVEKIGDLYVNNFAVRSLFEQRWHMHPLCQGSSMNERACWALMMDQPIITPVSIAHDSNLTQIYSNYPF